MSIDVVDLRNFYTQRLGVAARRFIGRGIRARFNDTRGMSMLGVGYAPPYLGLFREEAERCLAFMPAAQGVMKWPSQRPSLATLVDELDLPLQDSSIDRVLLVHALEMAHDPIALLREVWRVLAAGGRLLAVVPNRRGLWARMDTTPFGHAAGSCGRRWHGSARARPSPRRSRACTSSKRPNRSTAPFRRGVSGAGWCRRWSRRWCPDSEVNVRA
jgi:SAM-dependent methyltransferase